jgi:hypothetical protein
MQVPIIDVNPGLRGRDTHYTISVCLHALRISHWAGRSDPDTDKDQEIREIWQCVSRPRNAKLHGRTGDEITLDEVERIAI